MTNPSKMDDEDMREAWAKARPIAIAELIYLLDWEDNRFEKIDNWITEMDDRYGTDD